MYKMNWLDRPVLILQPDISLQFFNRSIHFLFINNITKQGTLLAFEVYLSIQNLEE